MRQRSTCRIQAESEEIGRHADVCFRGVKKLRQSGADLAVRRKSAQQLKRIDAVHELHKIQVDILG